MNKLLVVLLIAFIGVVLCTKHHEDSKQMRESFIDWMRQHNKVYSSEEFHNRWATWKHNAKWIQHFNEQEVGFTVAMNEFGDLSNEEFNQLYKGLKLKAPIALPTNILEVDTSALPTTVDWRTKGVVTGIKNQGQCGSCWSFSTTGSLEGAHALQTGQLVSLSEQNLMDCSTAEGNDGCDGGLMTDAFQYVINNNGLDTEASYPYTAADGTCHYSAANCGSTLKAYSNVASGSESSLQDAVANVGPVSVAIDASHNSFQFYSGGVYYSASCSSTQLDHGVLSVGYGTYSGSDYWLVKNSWGTSWGLSGYIMMSRNRSNNCGIATMASYPIKTGALSC